MKITSVEAIPLALPFTHDGPPTGFGGTEWTTLGVLIVKVETDEGITGYGEAFGYNAIPATKAAIETLVAPQVIGRDPTRISGLMDELALKLHIFGRYGITMFALSGLDIALWDIAGKAAGLPLHRLLGGAGRDRIEAYASLFKYDDAEVVARLSKAAVAAGYRYVKLHETTAAPVAAARRAVGQDVAIMLDVNCAWSPKEAARMAEILAPESLHWLEEPLWPPENCEALADLRMDSGTPIASGENACTAWQFAQMFDAGAVDYAQPSVTKVGGVTEFRKVMALAETANVTLAPHSPYFGPGFLASLHLIAASRDVECIERFHVTLEASLFGEAIEPVAAHIAVPQGPGLGLDPDPEVIAKCRVGGE
ncbi:MAG: mandelate racemase/muconate lactonizing enzyme family protein [Alphaproteobacteria bacterium]|mgnify:CR=1 FL=1|jgi:L-alanine-DL-glutamate epimerase-like enolase superfamily enzyme|nr:mandelate racemase/muconate lactonizing enzyme family protein [Alphaproteobacteria bacterium]MDP6516964.1 mandelate racemase/muconate lactonizing enzyme family protein [Alphaproteobacteria bacterium]